MAWQVPGYTTERMLGFGATGEVWVARDDGSGEAVALKRLRAGGGSLQADRERLGREGAILAAFRHPNVIGLRGLLGDAHGLVLVLDLASGGSLTSALARLDRLGAGEVVGFFAPVADALAAAHDQGLLHGDVSPGNLLLGVDGTPLLADLGTARLAGDDRSPVHATSRYLDPAVRAGGALTAASDVYALAAVAAHTLTARPVADHAGGVQEWAEHAHELGVSARLVAALCGALATDPRRRPSADELAAALRAACAVEPLDRLVSAEPASGGWVREETGWGAVPTDPESLTRQVPRRVPLIPPAVPGRWTRRWQRIGSAVGTRAVLGAVWRPAARSSAASVRVLAVLALVAIVGMTGLWWALYGRSDASSAVVGPTAVAPAVPVTGTTPTTEREWWAVVAELDARRGDALAAAQVELLDQVYLPGSEPLAGDAQAIRSLVAAGATASGVLHEVTALQVVAVSRGHARLVVTDRMPAYRVVARSGAVLRVVPARAAKAFQVELARTAAGWRIRSIAPVR